MSRHVQDALRMPVPQIKPREPIRASRLPGESGCALVNDLQFGFKIEPSGDVIVIATFAVLRESAIVGGAKIVPVSIAIAKVTTEQLVEKFTEALAKERAAESDG